jgi:hypothetical protein
MLPDPPRRQGDMLRYLMVSIGSGILFGVLDGVLSGFP